MTGTPRTDPPSPAARAALDLRLVQWFAADLVQDSRARLVEGGAGGETRIDLAQVFVDLPVRGDAFEPTLVARICRAEDTGEGGRVTLVPDTKPGQEGGSSSELGGRSMGQIIIGGPGSGKSTATAMIAQLLRVEQVRSQIDRVSEPLRTRVREVAKGLDLLCEHMKLVVSRELRPVRINLPELARWMGSVSPNAEALLWQFLSSRLTEQTGRHGQSIEVSAAELEIAARANATLLWIFDGLDEVPRSAGRELVVAAIDAAIRRGSTDRILVTTRPQGYEGEFGALQPLLLQPLPPALAAEYSKRLLRAWHGSDDGQLEATLEAELAKPEVQPLLESPLHVTMATLLVAEQGSLPNARSLLFDHYFDTIFKRELSKRVEQGIRAEDKARVRALHAQVGLILHTRSQERAGARPMLSLRELRAILEVGFQDEGHLPEQAKDLAARMLRFAAERLVLLLRVAEGGYAFGVRSLQEFFASVALLEGAPEVVTARLEAVALNRHWSNVLGLAVSRLALHSTGPARAAVLGHTVELCRKLNEGAHGREAAACVAGSRLAIAMLREAAVYSSPWFHDPLWKIALQVASASVQLRAIGTSVDVDFFLSRESQWMFRHDEGMEIHVRLARLAEHRESWRDEILELAEKLVRVDQLAGWLLLLPALEREDPRAIQIANEHSPKNQEAARSMLRVVQLARGDSTLPHWVAAFANAHKAWISPGWVYRWQPGSWDLDLPTNVMDLWSWRNFAQHEHPLRLSIEGEEYNVLSLAGAKAAWSAAVLVPAAESGHWRTWSDIAAFHAAPSKERLADVLERLVEWDEAVPRGLLAWPLRACLEWGEPEVPRLAAAARQGQLGDAADWEAAEQRWRARPELSESEIAEWLADRELPWTSMIATMGTVLTGGVSYMPHNPALEGRVYREISRAWDLLRQHLRYRENICIWLHHHLLARAWIDLPRVLASEPDLEVVSRVPGAPNQYPEEVFFDISLLLPDLRDPVNAGWFELFEQRGRKGWNRARPHGAPATQARLAEILQALVEWLVGHPDQWGLVDAIWVVLGTCPSSSLERLRLPDLPSEAPARVRAAAAALSLLIGDAPQDEAQDLPPALLGSGDEAEVRLQLATVLAGRQNDRTRAMRLLTQLLDATADSEVELRDAILGALLRHLTQGASPAFTTESAWQELQLPEPYLQGQAPDPRPPRLVELVDISSLRLFKDSPMVEGSFPVPGPDHGQWVVVVGENGVGKTTLLRALGLALADPAVASRLLDESQPFVRNGGDGHIAIDLDTGRVEVLVKREARTETVVAVDSGTPRPWVVGYGVRRGNARGEKDRAHEFGPTGELHTLFDRPAALVNAVEWLKELDRRVLHEQRQYGPAREDAAPRQHAATWEAVVRALKALLGIEKVEPDDSHVMVVHKDFGRVRLDALSDGYLTTTGWIIDLIARWVQRQEDLGETVGPDLLRQMTGIVLIDEIDLHLHPIWQMRIIDDVRRLLPRLSFIVTTHNALTLHGARPGEIFIMRRGEGGAIELTQRDIRPGHDVDRVLFEQFGIMHTFDHGTIDLLRRHRALLEAGRPRSDPDRVALERQLVERLGRVGEVLSEERDEQRDPTLPWSEERRSALSNYLKSKR